MKGLNLSLCNLEAVLLRSTNTVLPVVAGCNTHITFLERGLLQLLPHVPESPDSRLAVLANVGEQD